MSDVTPSDLRAVCASGFGVSVRDMVSPTHERSAVAARHMTAWMMFWLLDMDYVQIGRELGDRDPSTVWRAIREIDRRLGFNE